MGFRIGIGYDIHRFVEGKPLMIGGVNIPYHKGLLGHSDADVLLHVVCDALLGAAALGDIGEHFPDSDPRYLGADSSALLGEVCRMLKERRIRINNIDTVVILQEPALALHKKAIQSSIARITGLSPEAVGVKAKTNEGLDAAGRMEAIAAYAAAAVTTED